MLDQSLSSLTNFGLALLVARVTTTTDLGAFELMFSVYLFTIGCSRALSTEPLLVRYSASDSGEVEVASHRAVGTALVVGVVAGILCLATSLVLSPAVAGPIAVLGLVLPGLAVQDSWRYVFFAAGRPAKALVNDGVWAVTQVAIFAWLISRPGPASVTALTAGWGAAALAGALFGIWQAGLLPTPGSLTTWLRQHRDLAPRFLGEFAVGLGAAQLAIWLVGLAGGLRVLGALRAGLLLLGPVRIFLSAAPGAAIPELVRIRHRDLDRFRRLVIGLGGAAGGVIIVWGLAVFFLPDSLGERLLEENWEPGRSLLPILTIGWAALGVGTGAMVGLRALADASRSLRARLAIAPVLLIVPLISVLVAGTTGAAAGLSFVSVFSAVIWWTSYRTSLRSPPADPPPPHQPSVISSETAGEITPGPQG